LKNIFRRLAIASSFALAIFSVPAFAGDVTSVNHIRGGWGIPHTDKPVVVLIVGDDCKSCVRVETQFADLEKKHSQFGTDFEFAVANAADTGTPSHLLPAIVTYAPNSDTVRYLQNNFEPDAAGMASFLQARSDFFAKHAKLEQQIKALDQTIAGKEQSYKSSIHALEEAAKITSQPDIAVQNQIAAEKNALASWQRATRTWDSYRMQASQQAQSAYEAAGRAASLKVGPLYQAINSLQNEMYEKTKQDHHDNWQAKRTLSQLDSDELNAGDTNRDTVK
jgi:hypothetical protein